MCVLWRIVVFWFRLSGQSDNNTLLLRLKSLDEGCGYGFLI